MVLKVAAKVAVVCAMAALSVACFVDASDGTTQSSRGSSTVPAPGAAAPLNVEPMLVEVDTGKTMAAAPGDGVGVFVEYSAGGKWHVWWTCDTNQTGQACAFNVQISTDVGALDSASTENFARSDVFSNITAQRVQAITATTTNVSGVRLETAPGATIRIEASVSGLRESGFLFFVQDGKVNGGFPGQLTNPLLFRGSTP